MNNLELNSFIFLHKRFKYIRVVFLCCMFMQLQIINILYLKAQQSI